MIFPSKYINKMLEIFDAIAAKKYYTDKLLLTVYFCNTFCVFFSHERLTFHWKK